MTGVAFLHGNHNCIADTQNQLLRYAYVVHAFLTRGSLSRSRRCKMDNADEDISSIDGKLWSDSQHLITSKLPLYLLLILLFLANKV